MNKQLTERKQVIALLDVAGSELLAVTTCTSQAVTSGNTATSVASWRIKRLTNADNTIVWLDGNANFDNVWDNRASGSYT